MPIEPEVEEIEIKIGDILRRRSITVKWINQTDCYVKQLDNKSALLLPVEGEVEKIGMGGYWILTANFETFHVSFYSIDSKEWELVSS